MNITKLILSLTLLSLLGCSAPVHEVKSAPVKTPRYTVQVDWQPVTQNIEEQPINDVAGYLIHWGVKSADYSEIQYVDGAEISSHIIGNLMAGAYYFAVSAVTTTGVESDLSAEVYEEVGI
jgi:hypothetical protein